MKYYTLLNQIDAIIKHSPLSHVKIKEFTKRLNMIRLRVDDPNLYVGIVGEFSSGKSTLINALIGADFLKTNSLQGTTTVITKLFWGERIDMVLSYKNGKRLSYRKNKGQIWQKYLPDEYAGLSSIEKFRIFYKDLFHLNGKDSYLIRLFDLTTTSNQISKTLDDVSVFYPSPILKSGIVIVDTPGTDSLIPEHSLITRNAIKGVCDTSIIIVPTTKPFSESLADYIEDNIGESVAECVFFVTKIELLRKAAERSMLIKGIGQRITNYLGIDNPKMFMAPTLLFLEEKGVLDKTNVTNHLSNEERIELSEDFDNELKQFIFNVTENKDSLIHETIIKFISELSTRLHEDLDVNKKERISDLEVLHKLQTIPLSDFMVNFFKQEEYSLYFRSVEAKLENTFNSKCSSFKRYVINKINEASTKDDAQSVMDLECTNNYGQGCFASCYKTFSSELQGLRHFYEQGFDDFKKSFNDTFSIKAVDFEYKLKMDDSWQKKYNLNFSKEGLTTFPLFRCFKSLQSVKDQMKNEVTLKIDKVFGKMSNSYLTKINKAHLELDKQMNKVKAIFISKYDKVIQKRIKDEKLKEGTLNDKINKLEGLIANLETLRDFLH